MQVMSTQPFVALSLLYLILFYQRLTLLGGVSPYMFVVVLVLFAVAMTNVCNNIVVTLCIIPVIISMSGIVGIGVEPVVILVILAAHFA